MPSKKYKAAKPKKKVVQKKTPVKRQKLEPV